MKYTRLNRADLRNAYKRELSAYETALENGDRTDAWRHLERAHILSQRYFSRHWHTHWLMLQMAWQDNERREVRGQIRRLAAVPLGWLGGWVPKGNTGGADVHPLKAMPLPPDLGHVLRGYSPWKDVALRLVFVGSITCLALWAQSTWAGIKQANGEHLDITASEAARCEHVSALFGAEDIVVDYDTDLGLAVGGDRRAFRGGGDGRSRIFSFPLSDPSAARDVTPNKPAELKGFGADLFVDEDGSRWLGVANRANDVHTIEVYAIIDSGALSHHTTLTAEDFVNPNDLTLLTPSSALVTLDKRARAGSLWEIVEGASRVTTGRVVLLEAGRMETVANNLLSSNGIVKLEDGRIVVGELVGRRLSIYQSGDEDNNLTLERRITLPFAVDNLTIQDDQTVWVAGHPKLLTLARGYQKSEAISSPSMAVSVDVTTGHVESLFEDNGRFLSGSSVAVALPNKRFLIGTAFGPAVALCNAQQ